MKAKLYQIDGKLKGEIELPSEVFEVECNSHLLHQVVVQYLANQRQGTAKTKTRAEVSGGGRKPWRQKGTGRARAGSNTSPIWVRGGKAFGPKPRDYFSNIPVRMRKLALAGALSHRAKEEKILVVDNFTYEKPKTSNVVQLLNAMEVNGKKNLIVIEKGNKNAFLAGRNIKNVEIRPLEDLCAYDILKSENIIFGGENLIEKIKEVVCCE